MGMPGSWSAWDGNGFQDDGSATLGSPGSHVVVSGMHLKPVPVLGQFQASHSQAGAGDAPNAFHQVKAIANRPELTRRSQRFGLA